MSDLDDFLTPTLARQLEAEKALGNGDPEPQLAMWSTQEPVTIFGAGRTTIGPEEARRAFHWLATRVSNLTDYRFELVAASASGDRPTPSATNTSPSPWTAARSSRTPCGSPTSTAARTASGRSSTSMPTPPRPVSPLPPRRRRSKRSRSGPGPRWGHIGATSLPNVRDNSGHERSANVPAQRPSSVSIAGPGTTRFGLGRPNVLTGHRSSAVNVVVNENPADQTARREGHDKLQSDAYTTLV